jgi:hypothetical protein
MTYRELLEFTQKHPNPFWNKEQHDRNFEFRFRNWIEQQYFSRNNSTDTKNSNTRDDSER